MYDDLKAWLLSGAQLVTRMYKSEPIISVVVTELLFLVILYGPVDRKGIVGYIKEACKTILGELCQIVEQFIGESRSLTGFSGALHYIFFGRFDDKVKLTMVNYIAIFCSVILFLTSWLALKEFFGYPCGLFLAFVLQIVFLFFTFEFGMIFRKADRPLAQYSYKLGDGVICEERVNHQAGAPTPLETQRVSKRLADKYSDRRLEAACWKALSYTASPSYKSIYSFAKTQR